MARCHLCGLDEDRQPNPATGVTCAECAGPLEDDMSENAVEQAPEVAPGTSDLTPDFSDLSPALCYQRAALLILEAERTGGTAGLAEQARASAAAWQSLGESLVASIQKATNGWLDMAAPMPKVKTREEAEADKAALEAKVSLANRPTTVKTPARSKVTS